MLPDAVKDLPVCDVLDALKNSLRHRNEAVLQAPPGAGKTTVVPLALLAEPWRQGRKILVLEPRRMAARAAASRMAALLGEQVGQTVGYRIRLDSCIGSDTQIEVITEGILTRQLQQDPGLEDVALVIFDEFHERNLDSDLCLALATHGRDTFRESSPLRLLVMSATLDGEEVSALLSNAPLISSDGRQYPVTTHFGAAYQLRQPIVPRLAKAVLHALNQHTGSILVFLPGQREIMQLGRQLHNTLGDLDSQDVIIAPLFGSLITERQRQAIEPAPAGMRKIVLATNIAETSLTIEDIEVVVDSGLVREAIFDTATSMTRLTTRRISRASADQREGRAGRLAPGYCYRLWSEEQDERLVAHSTPELLHADLAPLVLQLLAWGVNEPNELLWLDAPPQPAFEQGLRVLETCGAVYRDHEDALRLTPQGVRMAQMPLHPRLAHMLLVGCDINAKETACLLAAVLSERNPLANDGVDLSVSLEILMGERSCPEDIRSWFKRIWQQARNLAKLGLEDMPIQHRAAIGVPLENVIGVLLASAYPDRIARRRKEGDSTRYLLSNGRHALLPAEDTLSGSQWLAVAEIGGHSGESTDRIFAAATLDADAFNAILSHLVREREHVHWDYRSDQFVAEKRRMVGEIELSSEPLKNISIAARNTALLGVVRKKGLDILPWTNALRQWQSRVALLRELEMKQDESSRWPDVSDAALLSSLETWLLPFIGGINRLEDFQRLDLKAILYANLPWPLPLDLERLAPERIAVPSGSVIAIDYTQSPPALEVKLQEMFGCLETPTVADGQVPVLLHLLSPAARPLQLTSDLAGFWQGAYQEVKREMKGRYPKHPWPDDPLNAVATRHTKRKLAGEN
ncbi:MAG: ATP-dependent helicase HrpB [Pseudomonadota bacterium]